MSWGHAFYVLTPQRAYPSENCQECGRECGYEILYWNCKKGPKAKYICVECFAKRTVAGVKKYKYLPENWGRYDKRKAGE